MLTAAPLHASPRPATDAWPLLCVPAQPATEACLHSEGLARLASEAARRTSLGLVGHALPASPGQGPGVLPGQLPGQSRLYAQPLALWQGGPPKSGALAEAAEALGHFVLAGGMLLVDVPHLASEAAMAEHRAAAEQALSQALGGLEAAPVPARHVLYRSFYLLDGVQAEQPPLRGMQVAGRLAVVLTTKPWLASLAALERGEAALDGGLGTLSASALLAPELAVRAAINWLMYALCLDYKDDQVHLPFLLAKRRR